LKWLEISLVVEAELVEAACDLLSRHIPSGLAIQPEASSDDTPQPAGRFRVAGYLPVDSDLSSRLGRLEQGRWHMHQIRPLPLLTTRPIEDRDWTEIWKEHFPPLAVGRRFQILPAWWSGEADPTRLPIIIDPGMAFGTGTHPSTQLCLELLEDLPTQPDSVLDLGTGSGILAIAAARTGATRVLGIDIDEAAVASARENVRRNGVQEAVTIEAGSLVDLLAGVVPGRGTFHLVLANLIAHTLHSLLDSGLASTVAPGGRLILSGILAEQEAALIEHSLRLGLELEAQARSSDWTALQWRTTTAGLRPAVV
jgi:ribosomal protein L11 methyltransferase